MLTRDLKRIVDGRPGYFIEIIHLSKGYYILVNQKWAIQIFDYTISNYLLQQTKEVCHSNIPRIIDNWQEGKRVLEYSKYMLTNRVQCDVTFKVGRGGKEIRAHKYVLASRITVFFYHVVWESIENLMCHRCTRYRRRHLLYSSEVSVWKH